MEADCSTNAAAFVARLQTGHKHYEIPIPALIKKSISHPF